MLEACLGGPLEDGTCPPRPGYVSLIRKLWLNIQVSSSMSPRDFAEAKSPCPTDVTKQLPRTMLASGPGKWGRQG